MPIGKYKLGWMVGYYENMLRKLGVTVRLGTTCTPEMLEELKPYAVFIATGSVEAIPPLPGIGGEGVIPVRSYLCERPEIKDSKVIVLGAGQTGLETARMLAVAGNEVTVVDMLPDEIPPITDHRLDLNYAREAGVKILMAHKVVRIEDSAVVVTDMATGEEKSLPRDKVIVALGVKSDPACSTTRSKTASRTCSTSATATSPAWPSMPSAPAIWPPPTCPPRTTSSTRSTSPTSTTANEQRKTPPLSGGVFSLPAALRWPCTC